MGRSATSVSVVGSRQVPAAPLLDDPLPVLDHFFGQPDYPAQGARGGGERGESTKTEIKLLQQEHLMCVIV